jgi:DNA-binding transcriptional ArsR family regulator
MGCPPPLTLLKGSPILHDVAHYQTRLDRTFAALVDPTRRAILAKLERVGVATVSELAEPFQIKLPAVMKHLDVLDEAELISRTKSGRTVSVRLNAIPMREAAAWLKRYERFWSTSLDRLAAYAEGQEASARSAKRKRTSSER